MDGVSVSISLVLRCCHCYVATVVVWLLLLSLLGFLFFKIQVQMGKKKTDDSGTTMKGQLSKEGKRRSSLFPPCWLAWTKSLKNLKRHLCKPKSKAPPKASSYTDDIDLPPSDDDDDDDYYGSKEVSRQDDFQKQSSLQQKTESKVPGSSITDKELKKREKKDMMAAHAAELAKKEALKDDRDAFTVVIGSPASVLEGGDDADANVKDITIQNFSVSARGKELLNNTSFTSLKISHGKRYGLVGPNGKGKSTLLKLLAWRKVPVPKNIDVLLVEQEIVGDDRTALEAVVAANEELVRLRKEAALLQDASIEEEEDAHDDSGGDDAGEKLAEVYEQLNLLGADAAEAQASKILAGLGFTKDMQERPTKSFSGGWRMRISLARALFMQPLFCCLMNLQIILTLELFFG